MIYFVRCAVTGFVKVGSTGDSVKALAERVGQLRVGPTPLSVVGTTEGNRETEVSFHRWLHGMGRHAGFGEWFTVRSHELPGFHIEVPDALKTPMASQAPPHLRSSHRHRRVCARCGYDFLMGSKKTRTYCSDVCRSKVFAEAAEAQRGKPMSKEARESHYRSIKKVLNGKTLRELCEEHRISRGGVVSRMVRGMTLEEALTIKKHSQRAPAEARINTLRGPLNEARVRAGLQVSDVARLAGVNKMTVARALREDSCGTGPKFERARRAREAIANVIYGHAGGVGR